MPLRRATLRIAASATAALGLAFLGLAPIAGLPPSSTAAAASTGPQYVQGALGYTGNLVTSQAATFVNPVGAQDLVVVEVSSWNGANTAVVTSVTDNFGNPYTKALDVPSPPTGALEPLSIWYAANVAGGANLTVTVNLQQAGSVSLAIHEYSGVATANVVDQVAHANGSGTQASSGLTPPTTQINDLLFAASTFWDVTTVNATAGTGYTLRQSQSNDQCCNALFSEDGVGPVAGSYAGTFTYAQSVHYRAAIVAFRGK